MAVNKVFLIGNLGKDPEVRDVNGTSVCRFSLATNERWKDRDGNPQERVEWHNIVVWGPQAKPCGQYLQKGRQVCVEGSIRTREYEKDGETKRITEINAQHVTFLQGNGSGERSGGGEQRASGSGGGKSSGSGGGKRREDPDDIPF